MRMIISGLLASLLVLGSSSSGAEELELLPLVPNYVGLTSKPHPSLCWILTGEPPERATMMLTLNAPDQLKPLVEVQLPSSVLTESYHCVKLKEYGFSLEPNVEYRWSISIVHQDRFLRSGDRVVSGMIERCDVTDCLIEFIPLHCDVEIAKSLARAGLWYDSISCLCDLMKSNPHDPSPPRLLASFMNQSGWRKIPESWQNPYLYQE